MTEGVTLRDLIRVGAALVLLAPLAYLVTRTLAARPLLRTGRAMRLIDALPLGSGRCVYLVAVGRRLLVLGSSGPHLVRLDSIEEPEAVKELLGEQPTARSLAGPGQPPSAARLWREGVRLLSKPRP